MSQIQDPETFTKNFLAAAFSHAEKTGWAHLSLVDVATSEGIPLELAHARFPNKAVVLRELGRIADAHTFGSRDSESTPREKLFELVMRRLDVFQRYRRGVCSALRALPFDPLLMGQIGMATRDTMRWIADAAGIETSGISGEVRLHALLGLHLLVIDRWYRDETEDLSSTMSHLDKALKRLESLGLLRQKPHSEHAIR